jgi:hypothetical protein
VTTLCECGCGLPAPIATMTNRRQGCVKGQPQRFRVGHNRRKSPVPYIVNPETGCWEWQLAKTSAGYGWMDHAPGQTSQAHRRYYEAKYGPIPDGMELHHACPKATGWVRRGCVNPDHMKPHTPEDHYQQDRAKLKPSDIPAIRQMLTARVSQAAIARLFDVHPSTISDINTGKHWARIQP